MRNRAKESGASVRNRAALMCASVRNRARTAIATGLGRGGVPAAVRARARCGYWGRSLDPFIQSQSGGMVTPQSPPGTIYNSSPRRPSPGEVVQIPDAVRARCARGADTPPEGEGEGEGEGRETGGMEKCPRPLSNTT